MRCDILKSSFSFVYLCALFCPQGVQIRRLSEVCDEPHRRIGWARLRSDHNAWANASNQPATQRAIRAALSELLERTRGAPFDFNPVHSLSSLQTEKVSLGDGVLARSMGVPRVPADLPAKFFCSQLATVIYQTAGIIPPDVEARQVAPVELLGLSKQSKGSYFDTPVMVFGNFAMPALMRQQSAKAEAPSIEAVGHFVILPFFHFVMSRCAFHSSSYFTS
jgi:hypothetical protein